MSQQCSQYCDGMQPHGKNLHRSLAGERRVAEVVRHIGQEARHIDLEEVHRIGLEEVRRTVLEEVLRIDLEEAHHIGREGALRSPQAHHLVHQRGGLSSRPWCHKKSR
jgi:hypothetical protein